MQAYLKISSTYLFALGLIISAIGCATTVETPPQVDTGKVSLSIDFPADSQQDDINVDVECSASTTVFEVMRRAQTDGALVFEHSSSPVSYTHLTLPTIYSV